MLTIKKGIESRENNANSPNRKLSQFSLIDSGKKQKTKSSIHF